MKICSEKSLTDFALNRLECLTHRGYSGAGIAGIGLSRKIVWRRSVGSVANLKKHIGNNFQVFDSIICQNRWGTHGVEAEKNSHPHLSNDENWAVVHNGEIYNFNSIKSFLENKGYKFLSETDTECIPNLLQHFYSETGSIQKAFSQTIEQIDGSNAIVVMTNHNPDCLLVYNNCQSLSLVDTKDYYLVLSDDSAIPAGDHVQYHINDDDLVIIEREGFQFINRDNVSGEKISIDLTHTDKDGFNHFMEKEIRQQPQSLERTLAGRLDLEGNQIVVGMEQRLKKPIRNYKKLILIGIGTSYFACQTAVYYFEQIAGIPAEARLGSEFLNRPWLEDTDSTLVVTVSQSGKTIEMIDIVKYLQDQGVEVISICNVVRSPLAKLTGNGIFLKAGPEKSVASTKAYTSQLAVLYMLALLFASRHHKPPSEIKILLEAINKIPNLIKRLINEVDSDIKSLAAYLKDKQHLFYMGRGINWPVTFEAALKLQEITYINARGYSSLELMHGPRAQLDTNVPCIGFISHKDDTVAQILSCMEKCHSAGAPCILFIDETMDKNLNSEIPFKKIILPDAPHVFMMPFLHVVPAQLLAYYTAIEKGNDPDYPRNLCKTVTTR